MNARGLRRYVDDLLRAAAQAVCARRLRSGADPNGDRAARSRGSPRMVDGPRQEFRTDLHRRLAEQMSGAAPEPVRKHGSTRRQVIVGHVGRRHRCGGRGFHRSRRDRGPDGHAGARRGAQTKREAGSESRRAPTCRTDVCIRSTSARSTDSYAASTGKFKRSPGCALIKGAGCGSTHPTTPCAAPATQRRSRRPARCAPTNCQSLQSLCPP